MTTDTSVFRLPRVAGHVHDAAVATHIAVGATCEGQSLFLALLMKHALEIALALTEVNEAVLNYISVKDL
jgi:hypothetical protein